MFRKALYISMLLVFLWGSRAAWAAEKVEIINHIPERYALLVFSEVDPAATLNQENFQAQAQEALDRLGVEQLQFVVYDRGKKLGDECRAYGTLRKDKSIKIKKPYMEFSAEEPMGRIINDYFGYNTTPQELYTAYTDNEVVADEDFKGKPVILDIEVPQVSKDILGNPYIAVPVDEYGIFGLQIMIDKKDPFLRKIKKGTAVLVRAFPKGLTMNNVILDGYVVQTDELVLFDGQAADISVAEKK